MSRQRRLNALHKIGLFHVHVSNKAGSCLVCGHPSRPEKQALLDDYDPEYDDFEISRKYERGLLHAWGYTRSQIDALLSDRL